MPKSKQVKVRKRLVAPSIAAKQETAPKRGPRAGTICLWPRGYAERIGVSALTLWRYERDKKLPKRDYFIGQRAVGWRLATIEAFESAGPRQ